MNRARRTARSSVVLLCSGVLGVGALLAAPVAHAEDATVAATGDNTFTPSRVAVLAGDTVTWTTTGGVNHTVTSSSANWRKDDEIRLVGQSTAFTFSRAGTYAYYCRTHGSPTAGMRGTVVVSNPTRPTPAATTAAPKPKPTPKPTPSASASPAPSRTPAPRPSPSASASRPPSPTPSPQVSSSTTAPIGFPTSVPAPASTSAAPLPSIADDDPADGETVDLGSGGLGPRPSTGRGRGLPTFLALVALGGVVSAQVRALLNLPVDD